MQSNVMLYKFNIFIFMIFMSLVAGRVFANDAVESSASESLSAEIPSAEHQAVLADLLSRSVYFQANFKQTVRDANGVIVDQSSGKMWLARPDKLRWDIVEPLEQTLIVNEQQFFQYDSDIDQLIIEPLSGQLSAMPVLLLSGDAEAIAKQFIVTEIMAVASSSATLSEVSAPLRQLFSLKPLSNEGLFEVLTLEFKAGVLQAISILDDLQQSSRFDFTAINVEAAINNKRFELSPPAYTDIIHRQ